LILDLLIACEEEGRGKIRDDDKIYEG